MTNERKKMSNTTNWVDFPVSVDGVQFISKIDKDGSFYPQLINLPSEDTLSYW